MKKLSIICAFALIFGLIAGPAFAANYCKDWLEQGNPGGWTESLKTFDEEFFVTPCEDFMVDIWINDCPAGASLGGFWAAYTGPITLTEVLRYNNDLAGGNEWPPGSNGLIGPWAFPGGNNKHDPAGPGSNTHMVVVPNLGTAALDSDGDIIIARLKFHCNAAGTAYVTISTIPETGTWAPAPPWDDATIEPNTFNIICEGGPECEKDADCDDGVYCNGAETCVEGTCQPGPDPCPDDGLYCNGVESCDEGIDQCVSSGDPCPDDGLYCNGVESCDEGIDQCVSSGDPCTDDGLYCNGTESCDEGIDQCVSSGDPCPPGTECKEETNTCEALPCDVSIIIGEANAAPGDENVPVEVSLENPNDKVRGVQVDVCDVDDYLTCSGCQTTGRTSGFTCKTNERDDGCCRVVLVSDGGDLIEEGTGAIFTLKYDVSEEAPRGECRKLNPENVKVSDELVDPLIVCTYSGEFCFLVCGDIYPEESYPGANDCGDGEVDIFDVLEAIDIVLGIGVHSECQLTQADVPNGTPPNCRERNGEIDVFDILVIIDVVLGIDNNCCW